MFSSSSLSLLTCLSPINVGLMLLQMNANCTDKLSAAYELSPHNCVVSLVGWKVSSSSVWFRRSTQTAQSQLAGLCRIELKQQRCRPTYRRQRGWGGHREKEREREWGESKRRERARKILGEKPWRPFQYFIPLSLLLPNACGYRTDFNWAVLFE